LHAQDEQLTFRPTLFALEGILFTRCMQTAGSSRLRRSE
jgi:hypothetical protein